MGTTIRRSVAFAVLAGLVIACATGPSVPAVSGSEVLVQVIDGAVVLTPVVVPAGTIRFVVDEAVDKTSHSGFEFVARGDPADSDQRLPLLEGDVERLRVDSAPQGMAHESGWGLGVVLELRPGQYVFMVPGPGGGMPGTPPDSVTVLTVSE